MFQSDHAHFPNLCLLKRVILIKKQHFRIFEPKILAMKSNESTKTILYLAEHTSL